MPFDLNAYPNEDNVWEAIKQGEGQQIELKSDIQSILELARLVSAFANAQGGWIIIGVDEPDLLLGVDEARVGQIFDRVNSRTRPPQNLLIHPVRVRGKQLLVVVVKPSKELVLTDAGAFIRDGARTRPISKGEVSQAVEQGVTSIPPKEDFVEVVATLSKNIGELLDAQKESHAEVVHVRRELARATSLRGQIAAWLISWIVGFVLGILASYIANHFELTPWMDFHKQVPGKEAEKPLAPAPTPTATAPRLRAPTHVSPN